MYLIVTDYLFAGPHRGVLSLSPAILYCFRVCAYAMDQLFAALFLTMSRYQEIYFWCLVSKTLIKNFFCRCRLLYALGKLTEVDDNTRCSDYVRRQDLTIVVYIVDPSIFSYILSLMDYVICTSNIEPELSGTEP